VKRFGSVAVLLSIMLCAMGAWAQAPATPAAPQENPEDAVLTKAVNALFECALHQDAVGLTKAIAPDAQILLSYQGKQFLSREDFVTFATSESISALKITDVDCRVLAGLGFAYGKMTMPGFVDGFFYGVFTKADGNWVASMFTIDPMAGYVPETEVTKIKDAMKKFGEEAAAAAKQGSLKPLKDRIDADHAMLLVSVGQMMMPPTIGRDAVLQMLGMAEMQMSQMPAGAQLPLLPTSGEDVPYPNGLYAGSGLVVVWAKPTVSMGPAQETPVCTAIMCLVENGEPKVIGLAVALDLDMGAAMGGGGQ
jgi:hypothetical protein